MIATFEELRFEKFLRDRNSGKIVWKDAEGNVKPLKDISDQHLDNILACQNKRLRDTTNIKASVFNFY